VGAFFISPAIASLEGDQVLIVERDSARARLIEDSDFEVDGATSQELSTNRIPVRWDYLMVGLSTHELDFSDRVLNLAFL
jgi:hypothetical protein